MADPGGGADWSVGLSQFACLDCGFESRRGHGCLSLVSVVCCQVGLSVTALSLIHRSPTECFVSNTVWSRNLDKEDARIH
jgi:hypothetical protein